MSFYLEALEGPYTGESFAIQEGTEIGRTRGQILLKKDTKVSSFHAAVSKDALGNLVLIDQESSNGLKLKGQKVKRITLLDGVSFILGKSLFRVVQRFDEPLQFSESTQNWEQLLSEEIPRLQMQRVPPRVSVAAFKVPVRLKFLEGVQSDESLILGFGPREFGADTLDIELHESISPAVAFRISPGPDGTALLTTDYAQLIQVSDRQGKTYPLQNQSPLSLQPGDTIRLGDTLIHVGFET